MMGFSTRLNKASTYHHAWSDIGVAINVACASVACLWHHVCYFPLLPSHNPHSPSLRYPGTHLSRLSDSSDPAERMSVPSYTQPVPKVRPGFRATKLRYVWTILTEKSPRRARVYVPTRFQTPSRHDRAGHHDVLDPVGWVVPTN